MLRYLVLYQSESGNTSKIAATIFSHLPGNSKDLIDITTSHTIPEAEIYFIGFCVHQGSCSMLVSDFLSGLSGKQIALFGTCGTGDYPGYYEQVEHSATAWIETDNRYLGSFFCQGRMPQAVRRKCEEKRSEENDDQVRLMLQSFDSALSHPDDLDQEHAKVFVDQTLKKVEDFEDREK